MTAHTTLLAFDYPQSVIAEYAHWVVLLRPKQPTLGALILAARSDARVFSALPAEAFTELAEITLAIESTLKKQFSYDKINYLMLMMVDPHVHFHVIPRYANPQNAYGAHWIDTTWGGSPALAHDVPLPVDARRALLADLQNAWRKTMSNYQATHYRGDNA